MGSQQYQVAFPVWNILRRCYTGICYREWYTHPDYPESRKEALLTGEIYKYHFSPGTKRNQSVFGANFLTQWDEVYVFESAIDCMNYWQRTDKPSVAMWGKDISIAQLDYLAGFKHVVLCLDKDRDRGGLETAEKVESKLTGRTAVSIALIVGPFKDYTDAVVAGVEPKLKVLPSVYGGRSHEVEKLYRVFKKKGK